MPLRNLYMANNSTFIFPSPYKPESDARSVHSEDSIDIPLRPLAKGERAYKICDWTLAFAPKSSSLANEDGQHVSDFVDAEEINEWAESTLEPRLPVKKSTRSRSMTNEPDRFSRYGPRVALYCIFVVNHCTFWKLDTQAGMGAQEFRQAIQSQGLVCQGRAVLEPARRNRVLAALQAPIRSRRSRDASDKGILSPLRPHLRPGLNKAAKTRGSRRPRRTSACDHFGGPGNCTAIAWLRC